MQIIYSNLPLTRITPVIRQICMEIYQTFVMDLECRIISIYKIMITNMILYFIETTSKYFDFDKYNNYWD